MARCETPADEDLLTPGEQRLFRADEAEPYHGPTRGAGEAISAILGLEPTANQDDWEAGIDKPGRIDRLVDALGDPSLDTEARSAIALLLLDCLDRRVIGGESVIELLARIRWCLRADAQVQSRMRYWWAHMDGSAPVMEALS